MPHPSSRLVSTTAAIALALLLAPAQAQQSPPSAQDNPASLPEQQLGHRFTVKAEDLPPPRTGPVVAARSLVVPYAGQVPRVPEGFTATPFA